MSENGIENEQNKDGIDQSNDIDIVDGESESDEDDLKEQPPIEEAEKDSLGKLDEAPNVEDVDKIETEEEVKREDGDNEEVDSKANNGDGVDPFGDEREEEERKKKLKNPVLEKIKKRHERRKKAQSMFDIPSVRVSQVFDRQALQMAMAQQTELQKKAEEVESSPGEIPKHILKRNEDITSDKWKNHSKHVFILSDAGKPIFTRYGSESDLNPMMAFFTTVLSHLSQDVLRAIYGNKNFKLTFVSKGAINLICASRTTESSREIAIQLDRIYASLVFILTEKLQEFMKRKRSFDLRSLLGGTDACLHSLISRMSNTVNFTVRCYSSLYMDKKLRTQIADRMAVYNLPKMLYSILLCGDQIIQVQSFRDNQAWTPLCLPGLTPVGYVYAYIEFIHEDLCLVFVNADSQSFFSCSKIKDNLLSDWGVIRSSAGAENEDDHEKVKIEVQQVEGEDVVVVGSTKQDEEKKENEDDDNNNNVEEKDDDEEEDIVKEEESEGEEEKDGEHKDEIIEEEEEPQQESKQDLSSVVLTKPTPKRNRKKLKYEPDGVFGRLLKSLEKNMNYPISVIPGIESDRKCKHFLFKNEKYQAITQSMFGQPYRSSRKERKRIIRDYKRIREKILYSTAQFKLFFQVNEMENIIGWVSGGNELYVTFAPRVTKKEASQYCDKIKKWLKTEESHIFMSDSTFK